MLVFVNCVFCVCFVFVGCVLCFVFVGYVFCVCLLCFVFIWCFVIILLFYVCFSVYTMQLMLEVKRHIERTHPKLSNNRELNYTKMGYVALGTFGKWAVNIAVLGCNLGVAAGYMIFISTN